jgi:hypothetical protein
MSQMDGIEAGFHLWVIAASQEVKDEGGSRSTTPADDALTGGASSLIRWKKLRKLLKA